MRRLFSDQSARFRLAVAVLFGLAGPLTVVAAGAGPASAEVSPADPVGGDVAGGYLLAGDDGGVYNFGADDFGSMSGQPLSKPVVGMAATVSGDGYWMVAEDGGIFSFGDADFHGSAGNIALVKPIVGMAATPTGAGYWFVASDGGIFSFGDADFHGSTGDMVLNQPIVGMAATPTGAGYWLVAEDGGIFSFGDADFHGSTGDIVLNQPIVGMAATPTGAGYWFVASDGGIFSFGDARFYGSTGDLTLAEPIVDMAATPTGEGYWMVAEDGGIFTFGNAAFRGSTGGMQLDGKIVDMLPQAGDITAPKLSSLSFSPSSIDTSAGPATLTFEAHITDDLSGAADGWLLAEIRFRSPSGGQFVDAAFYGGPQRIAGTPTDGVYQDQVEVPRYSEQGTWRIEQLYLRDAAGNSAHVTGDTLAAAGHPTTFTQAGNGDMAPPSLASLSFSPSSIDTSAGPATLTFEAHITDDLSGAADGWLLAEIRFRSPSGGQFVDAAFYGGPQRIAGTPTDGVYQDQVEVPRYSEQGTWRIEQLYLRDAAGNSAHVTGDTLAAAGHPTTFEVVRTG